jgi:transposase InsO family protein
MPNDDGYKYALVIVDIYDRKTDAEPIKDKTTKSVLDAFKKIYERHILKIPKWLHVDAGSEFKSDVKKWLENEGVTIRIAQPGRHRQQAIVERRNKLIATILFKRMVAEELLTDKVSLKIYRQQFV